jgi:hypothetical protein
MFQRGHGNFKENEKDVKNMAVLEGNIVGAKPRVLCEIAQALFARGAGFRRNYLNFEGVRYF